MILLSNNHTLNQHSFNSYIRQNDKIPKPMKCRLSFLLEMKKLFHTKDQIWTPQRFIAKVRNFSILIINTLLTHILDTITRYRN